MRTRCCFSPKKTFMPCRLLILISGNGSNLQALIDACADGRVDGQIIGVISNVPDAFGLQRAARAGIVTAVVDHRQFESRSAFDQALLATMQSFDADLIVLAGFMRILGDNLVNAYSGRMLNIHPSLLPRYPGLKTHQKALANGDKEHGVTIHFVTAELDGGPLIAQARCPILPEDDEASLAKKVHELEHQLYPLVVQWFASDRLHCQNNQAFLDKQLLMEPVQC